MPERATFLREIKDLARPLRGLGSFSDLVRKKHGPVGVVHPTAKVSTVRVSNSKV